MHACWPLKVPAALWETVMAVVRPQLPPGLINGLTIQRVEGQRPRVQVQLVRSVPLHAMLAPQHRITQRAWAGSSAKGK